VCSLGLLLACLTWAYCSRLKDFTQKRLDSLGFGPRNFSDLYPRGWMADFAAAMSPYLRYTNATSGLNALLGKAASDVVTAALAAAVGLFCWRHRAVAPQSFQFALGSILVLAFTAVAVPTLAPHIEVILIPACLLIWQQREQMLAGRFSRPFWCGSLLVVTWPWISAAGLLTAAAVFPLRGDLWNLPLATNPIIAIVVSIGLLPMVANSGKRVPFSSQPLAPSPTLADAGPERLP
jgi:hypothetical protein